jgi:hypothetical protein
MTTQDALWAAAGGALALAIASGLAEWLRSRRRNLDRPGWVPWTLVQVLAMFGALILAILAARS